MTVQPTERVADSIANRASVALKNSHDTPSAQCYQVALCFIPSRVQSLLRSAHRRSRSSHLMLIRYMHVSRHS